MSWLSYLLSSGALGSPNLLLSCPVITVALHITIILIIKHSNSLRFKRNTSLVRCTLADTSTLGQPHVKTKAMAMAQAAMLAELDEQHDVRIHQQLFSSGKFGL